MIDTKKLEEYLHQQFPITVPMGIKVEQASPHEVILTASFEKNINHKKTVFGGSLHSVAALCCWSTLYINLEKHGSLEIVITHSHVDYIRPVTSNFKAACIFPNEHIWRPFIDTLDARGKARINLKAQISQNNKLAVDFEGTFAALKK